MDHLRSQAGAAAERSDVRPDKRVRHSSIFFGFLPWIIFDVVAGPSTWKFAALAAFVSALVLNVPDIRRGSVKALEVTGLVFFAVLCVLALTLDLQHLLWLETWAQTLSSGVIALVALVSLAFTPFTEQYARESTPREYWHSPKFKHINRVLTGVWGAVFAVSALLGLFAIRVSGSSDWFNWVIPVVLLVGAVKFTNWYPDHAGGSSSDRAEAPVPARPPGA
ncbi:hypothetical protein [Streptomyces tropicalis]|uniref:Uncharacterized protein n=1 Tax=Streptomyces tropicalis TaxID=3034234 RepID=A0ABT6AC64_9ACTN|nr:hypothetical protein [Streptomyces tropicalis]MDF3301400.1 hypothetical protein [Streptomyces tropicalis]